MQCNGAVRKRQRCTPLQRQGREGTARPTRLRPSQSAHPRARSWKSLARPLSTRTRSSLATWNRRRRPRHCPSCWATKRLRRSSLTRSRRRNRRHRRHRNRNRNRNRRRNRNRNRPLPKRPKRRPEPRVCRSPRIRPRSRATGRRSGAPQPRFPARLQSPRSTPRQTLCGPLRRKPQTAFAFSWAPSHPTPSRALRCSRGSRAIQATPLTPSRCLRLPCATAAVGTRLPMGQRDSISSLPRRRRHNNKRDRETHCASARRG